MKQLFFLISSFLIAIITIAQTYPDPEFLNEVYNLKNDSAYSLVRLEKANAKQLQQNRAVGINGTEQGYSVDGTKSDIRFQSGSGLVFIFSNGASAAKSSNKSDSLMRSNGIDPGSFANAISAYTDPDKNITLYKLETSKGIRKIITMKVPGMNPFGSHKVTSSDKYTFSTKKPKEGYWVFQIDKTLPRGEYAFALSAMLGGMGSNAGNNMLVYAFGID